MPTLVLTVIGDDRAGLVSALAETVAAHEGNWEESRLAELAGMFAGIVVVRIPAGRVDAFTQALEPLRDRLEVTVRHLDHGPDPSPAGADDAGRVTLEILGQDHPGILSAVSGVFAEHGVSVEELATDTWDAPMAGGRLFEATAVLVIPQGADLAAVRADLEAIASEILVDVSLDETVVTLGE